ncbi:hypothetical protein V8B97DRAFT_1957377, partial [Scleroderma yunnanense]
MIEYVYAFIQLFRVDQPCSLMYIHPLGSDFLVEGTNVLLRFYASIARLTILGWSPHGLLCKA